MLVYGYVQKNFQVDKKLLPLVPLRGIMNARHSTPLSLMDRGKESLLAPHFLELDKQKLENYT